MGVLILVIIILGFAAGALRQELALMLAGAVFLALWAYCLLMTLLLALLHRRRVRRAFIRISPRETAAGKTAEAIYSEGDEVAHNIKIVQLPGILVRCRLLLATKDARRIQYDFNPMVPAPHLFAVEKRGAYFSVHNEFSVFDILGFFRFAYRLPIDPSTGSETNAQLLASPHAANEAPSVNARAGESRLKPEFSFQRTDNLIDHRPYVPGDDPRRINWKLYGHGGGLFVREGEFEPPPQSNIIILVDTEYDPALYSPKAARRGIDLLCENALAAALACAESGMEAQIGYSGGAVCGGKTAEIAAALAWPAASPVAAELPITPETYGVLILALPRSGAETSSLDRFLNDIAHRGAGKSKSRTTEVLFLHNGGTAAEATVAEACAALYNRRAGVKAKAIGI